MFKITQSGSYILIEVGQNVFEQTANLDSKIRRCLKPFVKVNNPILGAAVIKKLSRIERYMTDNSFNSTVTFKIRSNANLTSVNSALEQIIKKD
jgi:hypothetical protein